MADPLKSLSSDFGGGSETGSSGLLLLLDDDFESILETEL
jgi:hypothetical protein